VSYYLYLLGCLLVVAVAVIPAEELQSHFNPMVIARHAWRVIFGALTGNFQPLLGAFERLFSTRAYGIEILAFIVGVLLLSWWLSRLVDARMSRVFSEFWHQHQPELREQLKRAHEAAAE